MRGVATSATIIRTAAPQRSARGARLKNAHHTATTSPPMNPVATPMRLVVDPGAMVGTTSQASHCSATATMPGHSQSGFCRVVSSGRCRPSDIVYSSDETDTDGVPDDALMQWRLGV